MFGANPAEVKDGNRKGLRTLPGIEDQARALIKSLSPDQVKVAQQPTPKAYSALEIKENNPRADVNRSGTLEIQDIFDFLSVWFAGC